MRLARNLEGFFCVAVFIGCSALPLLPSDELAPDAQATVRNGPAHTVSVVGKRSDSNAVTKRPS